MLKIGDATQDCAVARAAPTGVRVQHRRRGALPLQEEQSLYGYREYTTVL